MDSKKKLLASTVAFFMGSSVQGVLAQEEVGGQEENGWLLEEVVVTATKRGEGVSIQDTAMAISVLSSETIKNRGLVEMQDYLATVPGLSYIEVSAGDNRIVFRGLSVGPTDQQTTSGSYLGEMPMSTASKAAFGIKLVDIERVEVLRGPQGTLFGSSALGGTIRNIPVAPNLEKIEGYITVNANLQAKSDDINQSVVGTINIPLIDDQLALRIATYHYENAGYVDAISTPAAESIATATGSTLYLKDDINGSAYSGGRANLLWRASEKLDINLIIGTQNVDADDTNAASFKLGGYETVLLNGGNQFNDTDYGNLVIKYDFDWATLTSSSSKVKNETLDNQNTLSAYTESPFALILGPAQIDNSATTDIFSQEIRIASNLDGALQFVTGLFYEDVERSSGLTANWNGGDPTANPFVLPLLLNQQQSLEYQQKAIFGEVSYEFNDKWLLTLGGRHFDYERIDTTSYPNGAPFDRDNSEVDIGEQGNSYKANLSYTPNQDTLIYAQWAEGFRLGRGQGVPPAATCDIDNDGKLDFTGGVLTSKVEADTTENFELGTKFTLLDNRLTANTALFRVNWAGIPVSIDPTSSSCSTLFNITNNVGEAHSQGIEFETKYMLTPGLAVELAASYMDTEWTEVRSPIIKGERLVYAPRTNASLGVQYNSMLHSYPAFVRADVSYVGEYETGNRNSQFPEGGDYVNFNLRSGISIDQWSLSAYASNLTNEDALLLFNGVNGVGPVTRVAPRKLGLEISYKF